MDKDRVEGAGKNIKGKAKTAAGKVLGDEKLKNEGRADQVKATRPPQWLIAINPAPRNCPSDSNTSPQRGRTRAGIRRKSKRQSKNTSL